MRSFEKYLSVFFMLVFGIAGCLSGVQSEETPDGEEKPGNLPSTEGNFDIEKLFVDAEAPGKITGTQDPVVIRARYVNLSESIFDWMDKAHRSNPVGLDTIGLNLFEDADYTAVKDRIDSSLPKGFTWIGHVEGIENSLVILVVESRVMSGNITLPEGLMFQIRYIEGDIHAVYQIDQSAFPPELDSN
ncbi:MAG: hypothetical protein OEZ02_12385 [Anaerolineae bacterium]|nr:hypothetical protein [Anaerolineae bacterium]